MSKSRQSVFMQMHNGERTGEGSFNVDLKELFYKADLANKDKLVNAFPEFFGDEVPEFGVTKLKKEDEKKGQKESRAEFIEDSPITLLVAEYKLKLNIKEMEKIKFIALTPKEAKEMCKKMNNMLCGMCYYGIDEEGVKVECPACHEQEPGKVGYYVKAEKDKTEEIHTLSVPAELSENKTEETTKPEGLIIIGTNESVVVDLKNATIPDLIKQLESELSKFDSTQAFEEIHLFCRIMVDSQSYISYPNAPQ